MKIEGARPDQRLKAKNEDEVLSTWLVNERHLKQTGANIIIVVLNVVAPSLRRFQEAHSKTNRALELSLSLWGVSELCCAYTKR